MFSYLYHQEDFQDPTEDQKAGAKGVGKMGFYEDWIEEDEDNRPTYEEAVALMQQWETEAVRQYAVMAAKGSEKARLVLLALIGLGL